MNTTADVDLDDPRFAQMEAAAEKVKQFKYSVPPIIMARSPDEDGVIVSLTVSQTLLEKLGAAGMIPKFMSLWYNIMGVIPPVPNIGFFEDAAKDNKATKLIDAKLILKGLDRPCKFSNDGHDVYAYILKPEFTYEYVVHSVCTARRISAPPNTVFMVFVRMHENYKDLDEGEIKGEIISWDWAKEDSAVPSLPHGFDEKQIIWR